MPVHDLVVGGEGGGAMAEEGMGALDQLVILYTPVFHIN